VNVDAIDAFDGTPILDIKPCIPALDTAEQIRLLEWVTRSRWVTRRRHITAVW